MVGWGDYLQKLQVSLSSSRRSFSKLVQLGPACGTESGQDMLGLTQHAQKVWRMKSFSPEVSRDQWAAGGSPGLGWFWPLEHLFPPVAASFSGGRNGIVSLVHQVGQDLGPRSQLLFQDRCNGFLWPLPSDPFDRAGRLTKMVARAACGSCRPRQSQLSTRASVSLVWSPRPPGP